NRSARPAPRAVGPAAKTPAAARKVLRVEIMQRFYPSLPVVGAGDREDAAPANARLQAHLAHCLSFARRLGQEASIEVGGRLAGQQMANRATARAIAIHYHLLIPGDIHCYSRSPHLQARRRFDLRAT